MNQAVYSFHVRHFYNYPSFKKSKVNILLLSTDSEDMKGTVVRYDPTLSFGNSV